MLNASPVMCQALNIVECHMTRSDCAISFTDTLPSLPPTTPKRSISAIVGIVHLLAGAWCVWVCVVGSVCVCGGVSGGGVRGGVSGGVVVYLCVAKRAKVTAYAAKIGICCSVSLTLQSIIVFIICRFICTYILLYVVYVWGVCIYVPLSSL